MRKKIRRSLYNSGMAAKNFVSWLPKATKNSISEIPSSLGRFKSWLLTFRGGITIASLIGLILIPVLTGKDYWTFLLITAMIYAIFAASWDFLAGYAGQVSFGHSIFFGVAGYTTAILIKYSGYSWLLALFIGAIVAVLTGLIIGIPCLRLKGPYLALVTLAFSIILFTLFMMPDFPYGGSDGISGLAAISSEWIGLFFIILGFMIFSFISLHAIGDSKTGTILKSIRDDETCAEASGINTTKYKLLAFMISGLFAGIAGGLFVLTNRAVNPAIYQPLYSFYAIIMAAIGGIATISGAIVGSFLFVLLSEFLSRYTPFGASALLIFAFILIVIIVLADKGVLNPLLDNLKKSYNFLKEKMKI
ncbi:MAG: branched-chain amino acid ABC transporter permease [Candidatus Helarchaeota archaeon]|nr:branched-chain amino acid ABC transporter permease [Candidatus Helarchaeota archaeon]